MNRTWCQLMLILVAVVAVAGCTSRSTVSPSTVTPSSELHLYFDQPRAVTLRDEAGESLVLPDVTELKGRMVGVSRDSIELRPTHAEFEDGRTQQFSTGATASVALADLRMEEVQGPSKSTVLLLFAIGLLAIVALAVTMEPDESPPSSSYPPDGTGIK